MEAFERRGRWLAVAACVLVTGATLVVARSASAGGRNGRIAFESTRDGNSEIYSMNPDGSSQVNLTNNTTGDYNPVWSPDGTKIAFEATRDGNSEIYSMNADGSSPTNLTNTSAADDFDAVWSPDGTKIAFETFRDGELEMYVMNADGSGQTRLTNNNVPDGDMTWSPDGTKLSFDSGRDGNAEIYVMNADGSGQTNLTNNPAEDYDAEWSPDGTKIAFETERDGNVEIYVMNADGSAQTNVSSHPGEDYMADCCFPRKSWSPDSRRITFHSNRDGNFEVYVVDADGRNPKRLTNNFIEDVDSSWSPDGRQIVFETKRDGNLELYVMNSDGTLPTRLTNTPAGDSEAEWEVVNPEFTPPETTITAAPKAKTTDRTPKFAFESSEPGSIFECKLDLREFEACTSPKAYGKLGFGKHTFRVIATDESGNTDASPAKRVWKIIKKR